MMVVWEPILSTRAVAVVAQEQRVKTLVGLSLVTVALACNGMMVITMRGEEEEAVGTGTQIQLEVVVAEA